MGAFALKADLLRLATGASAYWRHALASRGAVAAVDALELACSDDPGNRGIGRLVMQGEMFKSAVSLSMAMSVLIVTGFPCHPTLPVPEETDGPPGAILLASTLRSLGKAVVLAVDERAAPTLKAVVDAAAEAGLTFPGIRVEWVNCDPEEYLRRGGFDHVIAIERAGPATDGQHYTMRGVSISRLVDSRIDDVFRSARASTRVATTGVGDGGNELGTGAAAEATRTYIPNGDKIACAVEADFTVFAGVSNWGAYALSNAVAVLHGCDVFRVAAAENGVELARIDQGLELPTPEKEGSLLDVLTSRGFRNGVTASADRNVDGVDFDAFHVPMLRRMRSIYDDFFSRIDE